MKKTKNIAERALEKIRYASSGMYKAAKHTFQKVNLRDAAAKYGYYCALAMLLMILGVASNAYRNQMDNSDIASQGVEEPQTVSAIITPAPTETPEPEVKEVKFVRPVSGEVIGKFSDSELVWSETLEQWKTHPAVDISGEAGESILACADGIIADAYNDPLWGNVIEIEHENGMKSVYRNTGTINLVKPGEKVNAGDVISTVGRSAAAEAEMPWHVHVELFDEEGKGVDFMEFIGKGAESV